MLPVAIVLTPVKDSPTLSRKRVAGRYWYAGRLHAIVRRDDFEECPGCFTTLMRWAVI